MTRGSDFHAPPPLGTVTEVPTVAFTHMLVTMGEAFNVGMAVGDLAALEAMHRVAATLSKELRRRIEAGDPEAQRVFGATLRELDQAKARAQARLRSWGLL